MGKTNLKILILALVLAFIPAIIGSLFTSGTVNSSWYFENKPDITPPGFVFPIVWNILYFLIAVSLYFAWTKAKKKEKKKVAWVFGANLVLNALWSIIFFGYRNPWAAFVEIILLWLTIIGMIYIAGRIDKKAGWLLVPYLLWVSFAAVLNYLFWI